MNDNQFNQGGMGVPPVNNNPQGGMGVPPVQPMPQPVPNPMPQPMPQPMMNQPMGQPMQQPMQQPMSQAGFNSGMVPPKKKSPVGLIILGVVAAIIAFIVVWNVVLTKTVTCSSDIEGFTTEYVIKSRFGKIVKMKKIATIEYDSSEDAEDDYESLDDEDLCENYSSGCVEFKSHVGKKISVGVTLTGKALADELDKFSVDEDELDELTGYLEDTNYSCK